VRRRDRQRVRWTAKQYRRTLGRVKVFHRFPAIQLALAMRTSSSPQRFPQTLALAARFGLVSPWSDRLASNCCPVALFVPKRRHGPGGRRYHICLDDRQRVASPDARMSSKGPVDVAASRTTASASTR
jgi:hypothetical protein